MKPEQDDQTLFMNQEPWLEDGTSQTKTQSGSATGVKTSLSKTKKVWLIAGGAASLLLIVMAVVTLLASQQQIIVEPTPSPEASVAPAATDPFAVRFQQIKADLKAADPAKRELPFPPVNNAIELKYGEKTR